MKKYIAKLLIGTITHEEVMELRKWLKDHKNQEELESYVRDYHDLNLATLKNNVDEAYSKVIRQIDANEKPVKRLFPNWMKYAAVVALIFGLGFFLQQGYLSLPDDNIDIVPKDDAITLELDNGLIQTIDVEEAKEFRDSEGNVVGVQNQNEIRYSPTSKKEELVFNTLNIPNGKKFQLLLSDGTLVHLNAGSSLRYPVNFLSEGPRQVFLSGEAYFDVAENKLNPFIVNVNELEVKVMGTEFNVSAYVEDLNIDVVLVEGAVLLNTHGEALGRNVDLSPGQMGSYSQVSQVILVDQVNTGQYTSWMQGHLVFREISFDSILTKLERHYNVEIVNNNKELGKEIFNASFNNVPIEEVLSFFNDTHKIDYTITKNKIIIN